MILITICGRGGSKGVPGKNVRIIGGKPLIWYSIDIAYEFSKLSPSVVALSTDCHEIKRIAAERGLTTQYIRSEELANDSAGKIAAIRDLLNYEERIRSQRFEYVLDLDITSPLRTIGDLKTALDMLKKNSRALNIFSVSKARRNPYFNMVSDKGDGFVELAKKPSKNILSRQETPVVYDINASFYIYRREFFDEGFETPLTNSSMVYLMPRYCLDIDEEIDFLTVKFLIENDIVKTI